MAQNERFSVFKGGSPGQCLLIGSKMNPTKIWAEIVQSSPMFNKWCWDNWIPTCKRESLDLFLILLIYLKTNKQKKLLKVNPKYLDS